MLRTVIPSLEELWFKQKMMADEKTMSYNRAWGGTIPFPREKWGDWYDRWIVNHENRRYYRYLKNEQGDFVGEIAYHYDGEYDGFAADVVIFSAFRKRGYGKQGLQLLCAAAKENGATVLYDGIAVDNPAIDLFRKEGFSELYRTDEKVVLKKDL